MTSEVETLKTNEFLRRRKLRLQQVREQSKDIAKKIRQRTQIELHKQKAVIDEHKEKEYLKHQEKVLKRLEELYAKSLKNVGESYKKAAEINNADCVKKTDVSKLRGKEAAIELRKRKQELLDEKKKILDRKLYAREIANEISREKSSTVATKLSKPQLSTEPGVSGEKEDKDNNDINKENPVEVIATKSDMATQWDSDGPINDWEPNIPVLSIPKDDKESPKELSNKKLERKPEKGKRINLFALSDEMPTSLRGGLSNISKHSTSVRPSLTLVSEYLQNRVLQLRDNTALNSKKESEDLRSIKQTIIKTRANCSKGNITKELCHVIDGQMVPVPSWHADKNLSHPIEIENLYPLNSREFKATKSQINKINSFSRTDNMHLNPNPILRGTSPFRRSISRNGNFHSGVNLVSCAELRDDRLRIASSGKESNTGKSTISSVPETAQSKKNSITVYNHTTRNSREILRGHGLVVRDPRDQNVDDAYAKALKESALASARGKECKQKVNLRNKVAIEKKNVEKEYQETISFLNSFPKDKNKPIKSAYMDEKSQKARYENQQRKMQQEFNNIQRQCRKHSCTKRASEKLNDEPNEWQSKSISPHMFASKDKDFNYSWMPVPEGEGDLAIHAIPTSVKTKSTNSVKFNDVDSYVEYRSRHKHTPPTKEKNYNDRKNIENDLQNSISSTESSSIASSTTSVEEFVTKVKNLKGSNRGLSEAEKIIIYRVLESSKHKNKKPTDKSFKLISNNNTNKDKNAQPTSLNPQTEKTNDVEVINAAEEISEGVYKTVSEKGDNISSMYFSENKCKGMNAALSDEKNYGNSCLCSKKGTKGQQKEQGVSAATWDIDEQMQPDRVTKTCVECTSALQTNEIQQSEPSKEVILGPQPSATTSASSFKTATAVNVNTDDKLNNDPLDAHLKIVNTGSKESGKFYIGASGFLKDDNYEVVIQLKKKDSSKESKIELKDNVDYEKLSLIKETSEKSVLTTSNVTLQDKEVNTKIDNIVLKSTQTDKLTDLSKESKQTLDEPSSMIKTVIQHDNNNNNKPQKLLTEKVSVNAETEDISSQVSFVHPESLPKTITNKIFVSTACTQTSLSSPNLRYVSTHLSSSTSTAYMSPPQSILPNFFKNGYHYETQNGNKFSDNESKVPKNRECKCYRCNSKKHKGRSKDLSPSSVSESSPLNDNHNRAKGTANSSPLSCARAHSCHKILKINAKNCRKSVSNKMTMCSNKQSLQHIPTFHTTATTHFRSKTSSKLRDLDPVIKGYINKLLSLNREGLKTIDVINQECSTVDTPGSSIINVPNNMGNKDNGMNNKISLEEIKLLLYKHIHDDFEKRIKKIDLSNSTVQTEVNFRKMPTRVQRRKKVHKVKSLNIPKHMQSKNQHDSSRLGIRKLVTSVPLSSSSSSKGSRAPPKNKICLKTKECKRSVCSKGSLSPTALKASGGNDSRSSQNLANQVKLNVCNKSGNKLNTPSPTPRGPNVSKAEGISQILNQKATNTKSDVSLTSNYAALERDQKQKCIHISTQTKNEVHNDVDLMKLAEGKLQNMEKIADLTERCTKRLSNLAKVLEDVRRNKSLAYTQISTSDSERASDSDQKVNRKASPKTVSTLPPSNSLKLLKNDSDKCNVTSQVVNREITMPSLNVDSLHYVPVLDDIPKPTKSLVAPTCTETTLNINIEKCNLRTRGRPPPAMTTSTLKKFDDAVPHELSTVLEVDSPMSIKNKTQSVRKTLTDNSSKTSKSVEDLVSHVTTIDKDLIVNADEHATKEELLDSSKLRMIDIKQFNEIMLKPFITLNEYAKRRDNNYILDEESNNDDIVRNNLANDELSSFNSDGSLPDVVAELLKRNLINEPFKFDTCSNINSTSVSSDSTLSVLALTKMRKEKKREVIFQNKENIVETSDSLSISSNADLENAFKKLGMGWASSTLKKTKERLALSSSSNTSSSSLSQFKTKSFTKQDIPNLVSESVSSILTDSKKPLQGQNTVNAKNAQQQTLLSNSMTVKEFLTNELAKKITFTNKSTRSDSVDEFVSLYETKIPEQLKDRHEDHPESTTSSNKRTRTSTPVQIYKPKEYHSSSSSNVSNGLFSNVDELSSVKGTSNSMRNHSTSEKDDLTIPNYSLKLKKASDCSKSD